MTVAVLLALFDGSSMSRLQAHSLGMTSAGMSANPCIAFEGLQFLPVVPLEESPLHKPVYVTSEHA